MLGIGKWYSRGNGIPAKLGLRVALPQTQKPWSEYFSLSCLSHDLDDSWPMVSGLTVCCAGSE